MRFPQHNLNRNPNLPSERLRLGLRLGLRTETKRGSILIIVLWVAFGLCSVALYFAHSMSMEFQAADNEVAGVEAEQAIEGAAVYVSNLLVTLQYSNNMPPPTSFRADNVKVGNATFWLIGRDTNDLQSSTQGDHPVWGLVDEASKVNLNNGTAAMFQNLPQMTVNLAAAMFDWQSTSTTQSTDGAKSSTYSGLNPPYLCKNAPYETVDELSLVYGMNMDYLYGEDANLNGILDPNENDGNVNPPNDNQNGILDGGLLEFVTTWTKGEARTTTNGATRIVITNTTAVNGLITSNSFTATPIPAGTTYTNVLQYYATSGMSQSAFQQIEPYLMNPSTRGLINVNTATGTALGCIPGIGLTMAQQVLTYRQSNPPQTPSIAWLKTALGGSTSLCAQAGNYVTAYSYQYTADVAAVGHFGRGYRRVRFVFDCRRGYPLIVYRQDLTHLGWALGKKLHDQLLAQNIK